MQADPVRNYEVPHHMATQANMRSHLDEVQQYYQRSDARAAFLEAVRGRQAGMRAALAAASNVAEVRT